MKEYQRKSIKRGYLYSFPVIIMLAVILAVFSRATFGVYLKERQSSKDLALLTGKYQDLNAKSVYLSSEIQRLSSGRGIDQEIRDKFGVTKSDEKMVVIVEADRQNGDRTSSSSQGLWRRFINFFGF